MKDFQQIMTVCRENSRISKEVIDDFLIYYGGDRGGLADEAFAKLKKFDYLTKEFPQGALNFFVSEYIGGKIFEENGLLKKYLSHSAIKDLPPRQYQYLEKQMARPWRFSFAEVIERPAKDFYTMADILTDEEYLLYSPSMTDTINERPRSLWFNLIAFNGSCHQTFGVVMGFAGLSPDDIYFYAIELNQALRDAPDIHRDIHQDPIPYFMLLNCMEIPGVVARGKQFLLHRSTDVLLHSPVSAFKKPMNFINEVNGLQKWIVTGIDEFPEFAYLYWNDATNTIYRYSSTEEGFIALTDKLNRYGCNVSESADAVISMAMFRQLSDFTKNKFRFDPFETLFQT